MTQIWYDKQGNPIDSNRANELLGDPIYCRVARTWISSHSDWSVNIDVSTLWLGCNYNLGNVGAPIIFETVVFGSRECEGQVVFRCATEAQALAGHAKIVRIFSVVPPC